MSISIVDCKYCSNGRPKTFVGSHCRHCHAEWRGMTKAHCVVCHQTFASNRVADLHWTRNGHVDASTVARLTRDAEGVWRHADRSSPSGGWVAITGQQR